MDKVAGIGIKTEGLARRIGPIMAVIFLFVFLYGCGSIVSDVLYKARYESRIRGEIDQRIAESLEQISENLPPRKDIDLPVATH